MRALVAYASAHRSTAEMAERLADRIRKEGIEVTAAPVTSIHDVTAFDAVVLGGDVHERAWPPEADAFVRRFRDELGRRPLWLFSVGLVGDRSSALGRRATRWVRGLHYYEPADVLELRDAIPIRGHHAFVGVVEHDDVPRGRRVLFRAMGGQFGDHRDWIDVDEWGHAIARQLELLELALVSGA
ncbi:MAG TPA: flavodoxin domain-containing protein [Acidimicrobiia bacterium]|nr:flavodoxin domain-containing protein [Acidimicrobiia bacterium]